MFETDRLPCYYKNLSMIAKTNKHIKDYGGGGATIVLLHGFISSLEYWSKLVPYLTNDGYRVVAIDLLGFGKAPKPNDIEYTYADHIEHINIALSNLKINKPFILAGHSMGGLIASRFGITFPEKVSSLILLNPPIYKNSDQTRKTLRNSGLVYRTILDSHFRGLIWPILHLASFNNISRHTNKSREGSLKNIIEKTRILEELSSSNIKTMLLVGTNDRKIYQDNLIDVKLSPNVKLHLEKTNHHAARQNTELVSRLINDFLN